MIATSREHISKTPGICGGKACIAGHRIRVLDIALLHDAGLTPQQIAEEYPSISLADVFAAIAYYLDNSQEIAEDSRREKETAERYRPQFPTLAEKKQRG